MCGHCVTPVLQKHSQAKTQRNTKRLINADMDAYRNSGPSELF